MSENRYVVDCNRLWKGGKVLDEVDVAVVLASDFDALQSSHSDLLEALQKIQLRCECFIDDGRSMKVPSVEAIKAICDEAIAKALASNS